MNVINSSNFTCAVCLSDNKEHSTTKIYGHCHPDTKIGKRAEWIHGVCQPCFKNSEIQCLTCFTCRQDYLDPQIMTVNSKGVVTEIDSLSAERKKVDFIKNTELDGRKIGGGVGGVVGAVVGLGVVAGIRVAAESAVEGSVLALMREEAEMDQKRGWILIAGATLFVLDFASRGIQDGKKVGGLIGSIAGQTILKTTSSWNGLLESIEDTRSMGLSCIANGPNWLE